MHNNEMSLKILQKKKKALCVDINQLKLYLRIDGDDDDKLLEQMIKSVESSIEVFLNQKLLNQTWELNIKLGYVLSSADKSVRLPYSPLIKVDSVKIGNDPIGYELMPENKLKLKLDDYVAAAHDPSQLISVTFTCGYGPSHKDIPDEIKQAVYMMVGDLYENRITNPSAAIEFPVMSKRVRELLEPLLNADSRDCGYKLL